MAKTIDTKKRKAGKSTKTEPAPAPAPAPAKRGPGRPSNAEKAAKATAAEAPAAKTAKSSPKSGGGSVSSDVTAFLKNARKTWKTAAKTAKEKPSFQSVPDGKYVARVSVAELSKAPSSGNNQIHWGYVILEGEETGRQVNKWDGLETEQNWEYLARDLQTHGYDPEDVDPMNLPQILAEITDNKPVVRIRLRTKTYTKQDGTEGEFQNCYLERVVEGYEAQDDEDDDEDEDEDGDEEDEDEEEDDEDEDDEDNEDEEEDDDDEDGEEVEVGMTVQFEHKGKDVQGEIVDLDDEEGTVDVKVGKKTISGISVDDISIVTDEDEDEDED